MSVSSDKEVRSMLLLYAGIVVGALGLVSGASLVVGYFIGYFAWRQCP